jgi:hydrogenase nickel incorporation protein HypB
MIDRALAEWSLDDLDWMFIENVGNLVCPASYDLGEHARVVLISVTEGEDKPLKYPTIFNTADVAVVTKVDLAEVVGFNRELLVRNIECVRPGLEVLEVSARTGEGLNSWMTFLEARANEASQANCLESALFD